jgi:putative transposase
MPDHLHALLAFPSGQSMAKVMRDLKRYVAKQTGIEWQDGFFDHRLRQEESLEQKAGYIRMNPVRAGLVSEPEAWAYVCTDGDIEPAG